MYTFCQSDEFPRPDPFTVLDIALDVGDSIAHIQGHFRYLKRRAGLTSDARQLITIRLCWRWLADEHETPVQLSGIQIVSEYDHIPTLAKKLFEILFVQYDF